MSNTDLGAKIRNRRKRMGLTQKQLAEKIGKVESTVRMWELGKNVPPADAIEKISKILEINYFELMFLANHMDSADVTKLLMERDDLQAKQTEVRNKKKSVIEDIERIEFQLEKFFDIEDEKLTNQELNERSTLSKERKELIALARSFRDQSDDIGVEIDEVNDLIRKSFEYKEAEKAKNMIESFTGEAKTQVDLENIFNIAQEIKINGKTLTNEEKQKALQILKIHFDN